MDYGHPLEFGAFITPLNADPLAPVRLALLSEEAGLDLVTFQDHPYQSRFHETWTLLSWVAARTGRIRLAPSVINVPMRQPAVLARVRGQPRPAVPRPPRARPRGRPLLGRHGGDGRRPPAPG